MARIWGREESEWELLAQETAIFLAERARLERLTNYTELNAVLQQRTGAAAFDFRNDRDRAAVGALLGQVARERLPDVGALISAIVVYLNANDAGTGFYRLAVDLKLLHAGAKGDAKTAFWTAQVATVFRHYAHPG